MTWTIALPRPVPSANDRHVNGRDMVGRALYRRLRDSWARDLRIMATLAGVAFVTDRNQPRRRVVIVRIMGKGQREYDVQNLIGGTKAIVDAMQPPRPGYCTVYKTGKRKGQPRIVAPVHGAALIVSDAPSWVELEYRQERGEVAGCRIEIEDA
jgi:hypothetical protein